MQTLLKTLMAGLLTVPSLILLSMPANALPINVMSTFRESENTAQTWVLVDGLGDGIAPSVGAFDFDLSFDSSKLRLSRVFFTGLLGIPDKQTFTNSSGSLIPDWVVTGEALTAAALVNPGRVNVSALSLLEASADTCVLCVGRFLDDLQGPQVFLATFMFEGLTQITSASRDDLGLDLSVNALSDAFGNQFESNTIRFSPVPAPPSLVLVAIGLLALRWCRKPQPHSHQGAFGV